MAAKDDDTLLKIRKDLVALSMALQTEPPQRAENAWGGADVVISNEPSKRDPNSWYPEPRYVVTKSALEVSWAFEKLRDIFARVLGGSSKVEFYGRLANTANRFLERSDESDMSSVNLVAAVFHEAFAMLEEMEDRDFHYLDISIGNTIWDDLIERGEKSGYIGPEATRRFLDDMASKLHDA